MEEMREGSEMNQDGKFLVMGLLLLVMAFLSGKISGERSVLSESAALRAKLAYWECTDRTPEQPGSPTPVDAE